MSTLPPKLDPRTASEIAQTVRDLLAQPPIALSLKPDDRTIETALVGIFARYAELIIQRLNQVPDKNFLAFLDLLGASRLPPQPARAPLTFSLATGSALDAIVPAGTQVAAPPAPGESAPVIFETERELVVTAVALDQIWVRDPQRDRAANLSQLTQFGADPLAAFEGKDAVEHIFYIGENTFLGYSDLQAFTLKFELQPLQIPAGQTIDVCRLEWEIWDGDRGIPILPADTPETRVNQNQPKIGLDFTRIAANSGSLTKSGSIILDNLPLVSEQTIAGVRSRWLRCRLQTRIVSATEAQAGMVRASQLPTLTKVTFQATVGKTGYTIANAFTNQFPVDLSQPFYPFGEKPKFGDSLYLGSREAFSKEGAIVTLHIDLANLSDLGLLLPKAINQTEITIELTWEIWTSAGWYPIGKSTRAGPVANFPRANILFEDETKAFTEVGSDRKVRFKLPEDPAPALQATTVNGIESFWLRVRLASGNYGKEGGYIEVLKDDENPSGFQFTSPTFRPPLIMALTVDYTLVTADDKAPDYILTYNDFTYLKIAANTSFQPFIPITESLPTLHLGFGLPSNRSEFPNRTLSLYFKLVESVYQRTATATAVSTRLLWQYWSGRTHSWQPLQPQDDTKGLTRPGLLEFLAPPDFSATIDFNLERSYYWLRARWQLAPKQPLPASPQVGRVLLNTVLAAQTVTLRDEILGSSNGSEDQFFYPTQTPVLPEQQLEVREVEAPSAEDRTVLEQEEGDSAIATTYDRAGRPQAIWVRWHEVPDFYGSGPRDRHYVLNHLTGEIRFGNGVNGKIPPLGIGNLRMAAYRTGGGIRGNCSENQIVQLKTTIPYIDSVTNPEAATGGADAETIEFLRDRAPKKIRHGDRAVTLEDYEDLAMLASPEVARASCFPLLNLSQKPLDVQNPVEQVPKAIGAISVIIVPRSTAPKPIPSLGLINHVQDYLTAHCIPTATISVVGPLYIGVNVTAIITPTSLEGLNRLEQAILQTLTNFLHPLTGGPDHTGWTFGREPNRSDFYALIESIPGVDHVSFLNINVDFDLPDPRSTKRFLVYSGIHKITFEQS